MKAKLALEQAKAEREAAKGGKPAGDFTPEQASIKAMLDKGAVAPLQEKSGVAPPQSQPSSNPVSVTPLQTWFWPS